MDKATEKLIRYVDGELTPSEIVAVEARLKTDEAYQTELQALKQVDRLLDDAPLIAPPLDFMTKFETRLDQRLNRRRKVVGTGIIGGIMILATLLLVWSFAASGVNLTLLTDTTVWMRNGVDLLQNILSAAGIALRIVNLVIGTMLQILPHPLFWGYITLVVGLVALWAQLLRWVGFNRASAIT